MPKCWLIRDALPGAISIDNLLDAHKDDADIVMIGKWAIARAILNAERISRLYVPSDSSSPFRMNQANQTWLSSLFKLLSEGVDRDNISNIFKNLYIINFNYDRSLEYFIRNSLKIYYGISNNIAAESMRGLKVLHPYGVVGDLYGDDAIPFGSDETDLREIGSGLKIFTEGISDSGAIDFVRDAFSEADSLIFLGFAFHRMNLNILSVDDAPFLRHIYATAMGLSRSSVDIIRADVCRMVNRVEPPLIPYLNTKIEIEKFEIEYSNASKLLDDYARELTT